MTGMNYNLKDISIFSGLAVLFIFNGRIIYVAWKNRLFQQGVLSGAGQMVNRIIEEAKTGKEFSIGNGREKVTLLKVKGEVKKKNNKKKK